MNKLETGISLILEHFNVTNEEVLQNTPKRASKMFEELLQGMSKSNEDIIKEMGKQFEMLGKTTSIVVCKDIDIVSMCEHHLALMYGLKVDIAYVPQGKVLGLSKLARIADMVGRRLNLQERIGNDIVEILTTILESDYIVVRVTGKHSCCTYRGINKVNMNTETWHFIDDMKPDTMDTLMNAIRGK